MNDDKALQDFIAKYARPFDPKADDYDRPPFAQDVRSLGRSDFYNLHYYHTKVPPEIIRDFILHYTDPGDLILDPFTGSGMTGVACIMCKDLPKEVKEFIPSAHAGERRSVLNDISPAACHIAYNYTVSTDLTSLQQEFERITSAIEKEFQWRYGIEHYEPAVGVYDLERPEVVERLENPLADSLPPQQLFDENQAKTWEVIDHLEVERRLGYPVSLLPRQKEWGDLDIAKIRNWISIPGTIQYMVWSDVFRCEGLITLDEPTGRISTRGKNTGKPIVRSRRVRRGCGGEINLWQSAVNPSNGEVSETFSCPHCDQEWKKSQLERTHSVPVDVTYRFEGLKALKSGIVIRRYSQSRPASKYDTLLIEEIEKHQVSSPFRDEDIDLGREMMRHGLLKRGVRKISDFYTPRNLQALAIIWHHIQSIQDERLKQALSFCFTSQVMRASRLRRMRPLGPGEQLSGTLYIASLTVESNVLHLISGAVSNFIKTFPTWMRDADNCCYLRNGSATNLSEIPDSCIDFVFTDPPFGSNIFYADCAMLWENWLDRRTDERMEIVVSDRREGGLWKTVSDYEHMMTAAFTEIFRVLKPNRYAVVEFNNSDGRVFEAVKRAVTSSGFSIEGMYVFDKGVKTFKQLRGVAAGEDVVDKDVLFNLRKPSLATARDTTLEHDLEHQIANAVREYLTILPERIQSNPSTYTEDHRTTATINSLLMNTLIPKGMNVDQLSLPFIERVCSRYFRKVGNRWYLRGEAVGSQNGSGALIEEEVAIKDEVSAIEWIRQSLKSGPKLVGELKPLWMRATGLLPAEVSQNLNLDDLLAENFWRDADTNRWREPTEDERERMNDDRSIRVLHDAERFVANTLRRKTTDAELCEWINVLFKVCKQAEDLDEDASLPLAALRGFDPGQGYRLISQLFQSVLREMVTAADYGRAEKQVRVASQRLSKASQESAASAEGKRALGQKQMTLDWTDEQ